MHARAALVGLLGLATGGCESVLGLGGLTGAAGAPASSLGTTSTGGAGGGSGGCTDASACPDVPPGPCASLGTKTCTGGVCGVTYKVGPAPSQEYGSCPQNLCDATGAMTSVVDDANLFASGNACLSLCCVLDGQGAPPRRPSCRARRARWRAGPRARASPTPTPRAAAISSAPPAAPRRPARARAGCRSARAARAWRPTAPTA